MDAPHQRKLHFLAGFVSLLLGALLPDCVSAANTGDRPIVFSARFYNPPTSRRGTSYWHLYRVNPDGSGRRQITLGNADDFDPQWSPDGEKIAFIRTRRAGVESRDEPGYMQPAASICVIGANGGPARIVRRSHDENSFVSLQATAPAWSPDGHFIAVARTEVVDDENIDAIDLIPIGHGRARTIKKAHGFRWSPDGRLGIVSTQAPTGESDAGTKPHDRIYDVGSGRERPLPTDVCSESWLGQKSIVGVTTTGSPRTLVTVSRLGRILRRQTLLNPLKNGFDEEYANETRCKPSDASSILYAVLSGESTGGHFNEYFKVGLTTGEAADFTSGKFLSWSPDGRNFCTIVNRSLAEYGRREDQKARYVWVQPLLVGAASGGTPREIVSGMVYVVGADWRPERRNKGATPSRSR